MKPVLLHIGSPKTGTTSMQKMWDSNPRALAAAEVLYPAGGRGLPNGFAHHNLYYELQENGRLTDAFDPARGTWRDVLAELDQGTAELALISSEAFFYCEPSQVEALAAMLRGRPVTVIAYLRRQELWLQSAWNQRARFGRAPLDVGAWLEDVGHELAQYDGVLAPFVAHFGADSISLRLFDGIGPTSDAVRDFTTAYLPGLELPGGARAHRNTRAGLKQLVAAAAVLEACRSRLGDEFSLSQRSAMRISSFFRDRPDEIYQYSVISYEQALAIRHRYREANAKLFAEVPPANGADFPDPDPEEFRGFVDLSTTPIDILDTEERAFVERLTRAVVRSARSDAPVGE